MTMLYFLASSRSSFVVVPSSADSANSDHGDFSRVQNANGMAGDGRNNCEIMKLCQYAVISGRIFWLILSAIEFYTYLETSKSVKCDRLIDAHFICSQNTQFYKFAPSEILTRESVLYGIQSISIGGSGGRHRHAPPRVPILSFWHTNFSKRSHLGSWCPPYEVGAPYRKSWIRHW